MKPLQRKYWNSFLGMSAARAALAAMVASAIAAGLLSACMSITPATDDSATGLLVYVGTQERQMQALRFDPVSGKLSTIGPVAEGLRATWAVTHPRLPVLYAVDDDSTRAGSVTAFAVDRASGGLSKINTVASGGVGTTFLQVDAPSMTLLAANYNSGSVSSMPIRPDGAVGEVSATITASGSGPNRRQASAHNHAAVVDPGGRFVLVPDLGADRVFIYPFERGAQRISADVSSRAYVAPAGSGPRHLVFGADGRFAYLLSELSGDITVLRWDGVQGHLQAVQVQSISSAQFQGARSGAELALSADGRFVYVEDRGENTMVVYRVDAGSGELTLVQRIASGGDKPWGFAIHPSGKWLLVANQRSGSVNVFAVDVASGRLTDTGQSVAVKVPVAVTFLH